MNEDEILRDIILSSCTSIQVNETSEICLHDLENVVNYLQSDPRKCSCGNGFPVKYQVSSDGCLYDDMCIKCFQDLTKDGNVIWLDPMVLFQIPGKPIPYAHHAGYGRHSYNPRQKEIDIIKMHLKSQYNDRVIIAPVSIEMIFSFEPPASWSTKKRNRYIQEDIPHIVKPDTSNLYYLYENCLKGIVIKDDNQVYKMTAHKEWGTKAQTIIKIYVNED